ncbi:SUKH-4 family immunity protein [Streptomyces sp. NPDC057743]|uniref:SUKH-4 family immunity protein n=1 Tax=Streptomyces sp. NPDC057743 TaxID=3346236 RepID=UPI00368A2D7F
MTTSPDDLSRQALETVFTPAELITVPERQLADVADPDAREVLRTLGLPTGANPWFSFYTKIGERFERVGEDFDWELADTYDEVPPGADRWIPLAEIPYDSIVLDPETGKVHCLPQDGEIYLFNSTLRHFVHFLYILQVERPAYDMEWEGDDDLFDSEGARSRVEAAMRSIDPAALEIPESRWHDVLAGIEDPEYDHY